MVVHHETGSQEVMNQRYDKCDLSKWLWCGIQLLLKQPLSYLMHSISINCLLSHSVLLKLRLLYVHQTDTSIRLLTMLLEHMKQAKELNRQLNI